jgi:CheY-like chemotaxis protein
MTRSRVLVIDDDHEILQVFGEDLRAAGYSVSTARDGESALASVEEQRPDVIVCDVIMPGMNGFQFCRKLNNSPETSHIPVLLMSGKVDPADKFWAQETGAVALLRKPVDMGELLQRIAEVLRAAAEDQPGASES